MLVKVIDHKQKERYINASFVKAIHPKGPESCEIEVSGWGKMKVDEAPERVAQTINAAMPGNIDALLISEEEQAQQQQQAAMIAVIG